MLSQWFEKWLRKRNGDPKSPASLEVLGVLLREHSDYIVAEAQRNMDRHFTALMAENQKTNYLLQRFLIGQQMIAKVAHGIDLPDPGKF